MEKYELRHDEAVLLRSDRVTRLDGRRGGSDELVLTNVHLIVLDRGVLGRGEPEYLPLSRVKVVGGQPQALASKGKDGRYQLEVYFVDGYETFTFQAGGKRAVIKWVEAIKAAVSGNPGDIQNQPNLALPGTEIVIDTLKDTIGQVTKSLRRKRG